MNKILEQHYPQTVNCTSVQAVHESILIPPFSGDQIRALKTEADIRDYCNDILEWLSLISLDSPRISTNDTIDPYLSRYAVPQQEFAKSSATVSVKWRGLIPSQWIIHLFITILWVNDTFLAIQLCFFAFFVSPLPRGATPLPKKPRGGKAHYHMFSGIQLG